jgi:hypothetical protein
MPGLVPPTQSIARRTMPVAVLDDSDERFQLGDSSESSMAQLNPTSDTDTTAAIDSGA